MTEGEARRTALEEAVKIAEAHDAPHPLLNHPVTRAEAEKDKLRRHEARAIADEIKSLITTRKEE